MATEAWVEAQLRLAHVEHTRLLRDFVRRCVDRLERVEALDSFHFFYEDGPRFLLRVRLKEKADRDSVWKVLAESAGNVTNLLQGGPASTEYTGDQKQFGSDGWKVVSKFFECCCRLALTVADDTAAKGPELNERKLVHCLLNQVGYWDWSDEAAFYQRAAFERLLLLYGIPQRIEALNREAASGQARPASSAT